MVFWCKKMYTIQKRIYEFLFDLNRQHLSILYRFRDILLQRFQSVTLTFYPWRLSEVKTSDTIRKHIWNFLFDFYGQYISLSRTVFEIFDFKVFRVWPWLLNSKGHLGSEQSILFGSHYMTPYLTSIENISLSRTVSKYSTSKFLGVDLEFWPQKVIWGQKILYHSKAHIWLPIWLLWTLSPYLVPLSRYSTSHLSEFDFGLWPLKVIWGQKFLFLRKAHIWLPLWLLWTTKIVPFESTYMTYYLTSMDTIFLSPTTLEIFDFEFFRVWPWPLTSMGHLGSKKL